MQETVSVTLTFDISDLGIHTTGTYAKIDIDIVVDEEGDVINWAHRAAVDDFGRELKMDKVVEYLGLDLFEAVETEAQGIDLEELFEDVMDESDVHSYYDTAEAAGERDDVEFGGVE